MFKECPNCKEQWETQEAFLKDSELKLIGYMVNFKELEKGVFCFNHITNNCGTTLTTTAEQFYNLYSGATYPENRAQLEGCPLLCLDEKRLERCDQYCECAFNREITEIIDNYPKEHNDK